MVDVIDPAAAAGPLPIAGTYNLRPVAGVRSGSLYRSDGLAGLTDDGRTALAGLGLELIIDLRHDHELAAAPSRLDGVPVRVARAPIFTGAPASLSVPGVDLGTVYRLMITDHGAELAQAVRFIATASGPTLVHCTAGKDRTGVVVALAQLAAGVPLEVVIADYARSGDNLAGEWAAIMIAKLAAAGVDRTPELVELVTASPAAVMADLLGGLIADHGSAADYLLGQHLTPDELHRLRQRLTTEPASEATAPEDTAPEGA